MPEPSSTRSIKRSSNLEAFPTFFKSLFATVGRACNNLCKYDAVQLIEEPRIMGIFKDNLGLVSSSNQGGTTTNTTSSAGTTNTTNTTTGSTKTTVISMITKCGRWGWIGWFSVARLAYVGGSAQSSFCPGKINGYWVARKHPASNRVLASSGSCRLLKLNEVDTLLQDPILTFLGTRRDFSSCQFAQCVQAQR